MILGEEKMFLVSYLEGPLWAVRKKGSISKSRKMASVVLGTFTPGHKGPSFLKKDLEIHSSSALTFFEK